MSETSSAASLGNYSEDAGPAAAHQQGYRFLLELIPKMTPSLAHSTPFRSRRSLAKGDELSSRRPRVGDRKRYRNRSGTQDVAMGPRQNSGIRRPEPEVTL
jgi:hypothetical protein